MAGVVNSSVGYLGGPEVVEGANVTYRTVSEGDGNTEALRLVYNTSVVTFEDLARRYFRDPRVPHVYEGWELTKPQYRVAVWATDEEQAELRKKVCDGSWDCDLEGKCSEAAADLVTRMLTVNPEERASLDDVCEHEWVGGLEAVPWQESS